MRRQTKDKKGGKAAIKYRHWIFYSNLKLGSKRLII